MNFEERARSERHDAPLTAPPIGPNGAYEPVALYEFLAACRRKKQPAAKVAKALRVTVDRIHYAMGEGLELYRRKAFSEPTPNEPVKYRAPKEWSRK